MRSSRDRADDTGGHRLAAVEDFDVNPLRRHTQGCKRLFHVRHEASRTAEIDIRLSRKADLFECRPRQMTSSIEVLADLVVRTRLAVTNIAATASEGDHELADFDSEWMMLPIAGRMQPQDLPS